MNVVHLKWHTHFNARLKVDKPYVDYYLRLRYSVVFVFSIHTQTVTYLHHLNFQTMFHPFNRDCNLPCHVK